MIGQKILTDVQTVYLAGPMRGYERWNFPAFDAAKKTMNGWGLEVISPADLDREAGFDEFSTGPVSEAFLRQAASRDCEAICKCDALVLLPGWEKSNGVTGFELPLARFLKLPVYLYPYGTLLKDDQPSDRLAAIKAERQKVYGEPKENHAGIAQMWAPLLQPHADRIKSGEPIPTHVVALLMVALKLDRMRLAFSQDNYDDLRNYLSFAEEWQKEVQ